MDFYSLFFSSVCDVKYVPLIVFYGTFSVSILEIFCQLNDNRFVVHYLTAMSVLLHSISK